MTAPIIVAFVMTVAAPVLWLVNRRRRKRAEPVKELTRHACLHQSRLGPHPTGRGSTCMLCGAHVFMEHLLR